MHLHPPRAERKIRHNLHGKFVFKCNSQAEQELILKTFLLGDFEGRNGSFSSFSLCFEGDDYKKG